MVEQFKDADGYFLQLDPYYKSDNFLRANHTVPFVIDYKCPVLPPDFQWITTSTKSNTLFKGTTGLIRHLCSNPTSKKHFMALFINLCKNFLLTAISKNYKPRLSTRVVQQQLFQCNKCRHANKNTILKKACYFIVLKCTLKSSFKSFFSTVLYFTLYFADNCAHTSKQGHVVQHVKKAFLTAYELKHSRATSSDKQRLKSAPALVSLAP